MKSSIQVFFFDILSKGLLGVMSIALIRFMSEDEYALYTFAISIVAIVTQAFAMSFNRIYIVGYRKLSLESDPNSFLGFQIFIVAVVILLMSPFMGYLSGVYWFVAGLILATCLSEFAKTTFQRELRFFGFSMVELARSGVFSGGVLILLYNARYDLKVWQVLLLQATAMFLVSAVVLGGRLDAKRLPQIGGAVRFALAIMTRRYGYLFGYFFLLAFFAQVSVLILTLVASDRDLATFGSAFRYAGLLSLALAAVQAVLLPVVQRARNVSELEDIFAQHRRMLLLFALLALFGGWVSHWVIPWIDMGKYPEAVAVFRILAVSTVISFAFSPHINLLMRFEDFKFLFGLISVALTASIGLNMMLVSMFGAIGAAVATLIAVGGVSSSQFIRSRRHRKSMDAV